MNKPDKFFEQFREAAHQTEQQRFPGFDSVWEQVENKLDHQQKPAAVPFAYRRIMAVAAAVVAIAILGVVWVTSRPTGAGEMASGTPKKNREEQKAVVTLPPLPENTAGTEVQPEQPEPGKRRITAQNGPENTDAPLVASNEVWIKGQVTDTLGQPLPGATVTIDGTNRGVNADSAGLFTLKANSGDQLAVNYIGFNAGKLKVFESGEVSVKMVPASTSLSEVVVVGYGGAAKTSLTGSAVALNSRDLTTVNHSGDISRQLQGRMAGVYVDAGTRKKRTAGGKNPGQENANTDIRLRGIASVQPGQQPLYVINGKVADAGQFKKLNPADIDKVDVLKDASATAIFGSRAANGVVVITTRNLSAADEQRIDRMNEKMQQKGVQADTMLIERYTEEDYNVLVENPFTSPQVSPLSTFSIDVDNASYTNIRRFINNGQKVPADAVRIEEMVNFFTYRYASPGADRPFAAHTAYSDAPWNPQHKLLRIALKAKDIPAGELPPSNIVFLLDVSGSMNAPNKLPLLKSSMKVLVNQLRSADKVSIVVYAGAAGLVLPPTGGDNKAAIMEALDKLEAGGSTAGGAGIELAYKTAAENFVKDGNNRVVLATDGDFNVGINTEGDLQHLIEEKRKSGIFLTCLGFGMGNYKDNRLETLADKGNGNYAYIDNMQESDRFLGKEFKGTMFAVAKDVKLQVEFNPAAVKSYRLIGYENRRLNDEDFVNDKIDAGEMGIGHTVTALYEIIPAGVNSSFAPNLPALKYKTGEAANGNANELATIKFRYKKPDGASSTEWSQVVPAASTPLQQASEDFRFAAAVAWFGLKLRNSDLIADKNMPNIIRLAKSAASFDPEGYRAECIRLMELAK